jgi:hypothetical protein
MAHGRKTTNMPAWNSQAESAYVMETLTKAQLYALYRDILAQTLGKDWIDVTLADVKTDVAERSEAMRNAEIYPHNGEQFSRLPKTF